MSRCDRCGDPVEYARKLKLKCLEAATESFKVTTVAGGTADIIRRAAGFYNYVSGKND